MILDNNSTLESVIQIHDTPGSINGISIDVNSVQHVMSTIGLEVFT
jgi:hypothetical protein